MSVAEAVRLLGCAQLRVIAWLAAATLMLPKLRVLEVTHMAPGASTLLRQTLHDDVFAELRNAAGHVRRADLHLCCVALLMRVM